jgi:rubrerythrin
MVTTVGTETTLPGLVENLLLLEHDAIAAYEQTIARLENQGYKQKIAEFKGDHDRHVQELTRLATTVGAKAYREGDAKQMLTTGKVALASIMGDSATLAAMRSNEEDTVTAYERASRHAEATPEARAFFERAHADEVRHRDWMSNPS